jgi:predicted TIM-barrel fold metal-dependent hydrolase
MNEILQVCDPHFHLWNTHERPNPNLGDAVQTDLPVYLAADYAHDTSQLPAPLKLASAVHVETIVGQMEGGFPLDSVAETKWVCEQLAAMEAQLPFAVVAYVHLARDIVHTDLSLAQHLAQSKGRLRGVRMILNHHPHNPDLTWPQVEHGDFLSSNLFREGIALLGENNLSFDLQCNPLQLEGAAEVFRNYPDTPVILNHLGLLHDGEDAAYEDMWRDGLRALAACPHSFVKLSMLWFARTGFHENVEAEAKVRELVREVIDIFGCQRCMFASNFPVDRIMGIDIQTLYTKFLDWTADLSDSDRSALFHDTAVHAYRLRELRI